MYTDRIEESFINSRVEGSTVVATTPNWSTLINSIKFPNCSLFLKPKHMMFTSLQKYVPNIIYDRYYLKSYYIKINRDNRIIPKDKNFLPPKFLGQYCYILSNNDDYIEIDMITDHFIESERLKTSRFPYMSPMEIWDDIEKRKLLFNKEEIPPLFDQEQYMKGVVTQKMYKFLMKIRKNLYDVTFESKHFRPTWVIGIFDILKIPKGSKILDISAGWGDRLIASISKNMEYVGYDPNKKLKDCYHSIINHFGDPSKHRVIIKPFEDSENDDYGLFDLMISSPPFYTTESYSKDKDQSDLRYPKYEDWMTKFLFRSLQISWNKLKIGGKIAIHIADPKINSACNTSPFCKKIETSSIIHLSEPMNLYIKDHLPGSIFLGIIGVTGKVGEGRPVWIWEKRLENNLFKNGKKQKDGVLTSPENMKIEKVKSLSKAYMELKI